MKVHTLWMLEVIAFLLMLGTGFLILRMTPPQAKRLTLTFYLQSLGLAWLFIIFSLAQGWSALLLRPGSAVLVLCSPLILGILARIFAVFFSHATASSAQSALALFLYGLMILGLMTFLLLQPLALFFAVVVGALLLTAFSLIFKEGAAREVPPSLLLLIFMGILRLGMLEPMLRSLPEWAGMIFRPLLFVQAGMVVAWSALIAYRGVESLSYQKNSNEAGKALALRYEACLRLGISAFLLINLFYTVFWVSVWDHTDNGLAGVWMAITGSFLAIAAGGLMLERKTDRLRLLGTVFIIPVSLLLWAAFGLGIRFPYHPISDQRAALIQEAIQRHYEQSGAYPDSLAELVPRQLTWVPRQLILRNEDWCYQGGKDYYRLGAFWRERFSGLLEVKVYASAGNPPEAGWVCQEELTRMKFKYDPPMFFDGGP